MPLQCCVNIKLGQHFVAIRDIPERQDIQTMKQGSSFFPAVGFS
jgi:hypothetical protein